MTEKLKTALEELAEAATAELDKLIEFTEENAADCSIIELRALTHLVGRVLPRLVDVVTDREIHQAFGAPGDWGYDTPLGDALYRLYRGES